MPQINYTGINQIVECPESQTSILEASLLNRIPHLHECGGSGRCTTCRVRVLDGMQNLEPRTALEKVVSTARNWDPSIRLACQTRINGDVSIQRLLWANTEISSLQLETLPEGEAEERDLVILFCDIRGFTRMSSNRLVFDTAHLLNRFYTAVGDPILLNNGIIYQYVGDEIVAVFGTSGGDKQKHCIDALRAALGMLYAIERLNKFELEGFETKLKIGIGLHHGSAFVGNLGHPKHRQFAVIGDPVNIASRIQKATRETGANLLISESVFASLERGTLIVDGTHVITPEGKDQEIVLRAITGFTKPDMALQLQSSLDVLLNDEEQFAAHFYEQLFAVLPEVRELFTGDMTNQGRLLMHMLGGVVHSLSRPEYLVLGLKMLGRRHAQYGVKGHHYPVVRKVLLQTIKDRLGPEVAPETIDAWHDALEFVTEKMQSHRPVI